jgi:type IV pilus assembly protein PilO
MRQILLELFRLERRSLIVIAGLVLVNCLLLAAIGVYQWPAMDRARHARDDLRGRVAALGRGDVTSLYRRGTADLERLRTRIPAKRDFARVLSEVIDTVAANNLTLGGVTYKPQRIKDEALLAYGVTLSVSGRYAGIKSLIGDLQKERELVVVDGVSLSNGSPYEENIAMDLHLTVYLREGA